MKIKKIYFIVIITVIFSSILAYIVLNYPTIITSKLESRKCNIKYCKLNISKDNAFYEIQGIILDKYNHKNQFVIKLATLNSRQEQVVFNTEFFPEFDKIIVNYKKSIGNIYSQEESKEEFFHTLQKSEHIGINIPVYKKDFKTDYRRIFSSNLSKCIENNDHYFNYLINSNFRTILRFYLTSFNNNCNIMFSSINIYD